MKILWGNGYARAAVLGSVVVLILTLGDDGLAADSFRPVPLRLAYSAMTVNQAIPWISVEAGHFKKHGLDVEVVHASSLLAMQALLAGEVAVAQSVTDACVTANLSGADPRRFVDSSLLDELEKEGFLKGLYRN